MKQIPTLKVVGYTSRFPLHIRKRAYAKDVSPFSCWSPGRFGQPNYYCKTQGQHHTAPAISLRLYMSVYLRHLLPQKSTPRHPAASHAFHRGISYRRRNHPWPLSDPDRLYRSSHPAHAEMIAAPGHLPQMIWRKSKALRQAGYQSLLKEFSLHVLRCEREFAQAYHDTQ